MKIKSIHEIEITRTISQMNFAMQKKNTSEEFCELYHVRRTAPKERREALLYDQPIRFCGSLTSSIVMASRSLSGSFIQQIVICCPSGSFSHPMGSFVLLCAPLRPLCELCDTVTAPLCALWAFVVQAFPTVRVFNKKIPLRKTKRDISWIGFVIRLYKTNQ